MNGNETYTFWMRILDYEWKLNQYNLDENSRL